METYACERRSRIETAVHSDAFVHSADIAGTTGGWSTVPRGVCARRQRNVDELYGIGDSVNLTRRCNDGQTIPVPCILAKGMTRFMGHGCPRLFWKPQVTQELGVAGLPRSFRPGFSSPSGPVQVSPK
ncbi:hypothetical protein H107_06655 [Trichophyton rubrum CBS 202.88]|nr:hypothetical protein H100_06516 [Trichophyton rubrum MR850]EZF39391.1 hypothetical protein H102_06483 [Trichophyton rubrum CBS 100081]EZG14111.1 hypothetical protein H107_06655 [Trichophyton rubrum CBS 202.88]